MTNLILNAKEIAKVNNVAIMAGNDAMKLVPIKPICEALGIDDRSQRQKIQSHPILASTGVLSTLVASDGKTREMYCIPFEYVFGWLFTINPANVKEESREGLIKYQQECYHALYEYFSSYASFVNQKQKRQAEDWARYQVIQKEFHEAKAKLAQAKKMMNKTVEYSFEEWNANNRQLVIEFD